MSGSWGNTVGSTREEFGVHLQEEGCQKRTWFCMRLVLELYRKGYIIDSSELQKALIHVIITVVFCQNIALTV